MKMKAPIGTTLYVLLSLLSFYSCNAQQGKTLTPMQRYMLAHRRDSLMQDSINKAIAAKRPKAIQLLKVKIGTQIWASKNLDVVTFQNGDTIPEKESKYDFQQAGDNGQPAWCYYNGDKKNSKYGKYYNWYAIHDSRGLAPQGWHIPTDEEWAVLANYLGQDTGGEKMKSKNDWNGDNSSGFDALPAGYSNGSAGDDLGEFAIFWSATEFPNKPSEGSVRELGSDNPHFIQSYNSTAKSSGNSVRCIQDQ